MSSQITPIVFVQDYAPRQQSKLYQLDLATGQATLVGEIGTEIYDLAVVDSELYALDKKNFSLRKTMNLVKVNQTTGTTEVIGNIGHDVVGLAYNPGTQKLYATAHTKHQIIEINPKTGKGKVAVTLSDRDRQVGEIAFDGSGKAYISLIGTDLKKYLATFDLSGGKVDLIGEIYFPGLASMKFVGETLYGVGGSYEGLGGKNGQLIRIDTETGCGSLVLNTKPELCWAGMAIAAPSMAIAPGDEMTPELSGPCGVAEEQEQPTLISVGGGAGSGNSGGSGSGRSSGGPISGGDFSGSDFSGGDFSGDFGSGEELNFSFKFDDSQLEEAWKKIASKVEESVTVTDEQDAALEAQRWDQLENWLLTGYKQQAKDLAMQVARLELMMSTFKDQLEGNLQLTFRRWSSHFDGRLQSIVGNQITEVTQGSLIVAIEQLKLDLLNQTSQLVQTEINAAKVELSKSIDAQISTVQGEFREQLQSRITEIQADIFKSIETKITTARAEFEKSIETQISTVKNEVTETIDTKIVNVTKEIKENVNISKEVSTEISEKIKTSIFTDIDTKFSDVQTDISTLEKSVDNKLETLRVDFRGEVVSTVLDQINALIEEKTKLEMAKVDFNTYIAQIDARANGYLDQLKQLEVTLIGRINEGDTHLYNWVLEQLMTLKGCLSDRQVLVDQLALFSNELKTRLDTAPCVNPSVFSAWSPLPLESNRLPAAPAIPQLPSA